MTTFLLIRHGTTSWIGHALAGHIEGVGLNEGGLTEARQLAGRLRKWPIRAIYSSPLQRAVETATPLAEALGLPVQPRERLTEIRFGRWSGSRIADIETDERWSKFNGLRSLTRAPGGELMLEVQARMADELNELACLHPDHMVALFSHADVIRSAVLLCLGVPLDLFYRVEISPASVSILDFGPAGPVVRSLNMSDSFGYKPHV
jgi:probable phosphoglycerate mutase